MEKTNLNDGLMAQMIEEEAWKNLSCLYPWSEALLEKYKDKVDWEEISRNDNLQWTIPMLEKYKNRLNWQTLSQTRQDSLLSPEIVDKFRDRWDWKELSENSRLPIETIRKMADFIDWRALVQRSYNENIHGIDFFLEFKDRIPAWAFKDSFLMSKMVEEKERIIRTEIASN